MSEQKWLRGQGGRAGFGHVKTQPISLFQNQSRDYSPSGNAVRPFPLSLRKAEDLLHKRGVDISHETVLYWWNRFGPMGILPFFMGSASRITRPFSVS